ncbi:helix-turn-helix XRE-family transcriptional regulators [Candidatus Termititenax aidoneus]|uniref:Helix-turn-helix XRE-family transcriptional regulators n=1 Tax=Termititenax aidoneus TaxID=2218524 RepID=A0A388T9A2_TERA1|nr:helix-turn-helix XRE-family transcriptional regulators [Candidatus Termititenax aidoneus]
MSKEFTSADLKLLLSEKLSLLRQNSGETIEAAADSLDMAVSEYFRFLKGHRLPHLLTLLRINQKYGVNMDWWFSSLNELPGNPTVLKQHSFERQILCELKKVPPDLQKALLNMLKAFNKNLPTKWV